jgi:hypothetical protein
LLPRRVRLGLRPPPRIPRFLEISNLTTNARTWRRLLTAVRYLQRPFRAKQAFRPCGLLFWNSRSWQGIIVLNQNAAGKWSPVRLQPERLSLAGPLRWQIAQAGDAHAVRTPPLDGGLDEVGSEERQRDRHVYLSHAAALARGDALGVRASILHQFIEPTPPPCNRYYCKRSFHSGLDEKWQSRFY